MTELADDFLGSLFTLGGIDYAEGLIPCEDS